MAALLFTAGTRAEAAVNIGCMDAGYSEDETAQGANFVKDFAMERWKSDGLPPDMLALISGHAGKCADANGWSPEAIEQAVYYRTGVLLTAAIEAKTPLTPTQMNRLHQVFSGPDKAKLVAIFAPKVNAIVAGNPAPEPTQADQMFFARMILRTGIPATEANAHFVGTWMGGQTIAELARARFQSL